MKNKRLGFTLIELLVVVSIIALLSTAGLIALRTAQRAGRDAKRISDMRSVQNALEIYFNRSGSYPQVFTWAELQAELALVGISSVPNDPIYTGSEASYLYAPAPAVGGSANNYVLRARLELTDNRALLNDADGTLYGVDCGFPGAFPEDPPYYCVQL